MRNWFKHYWAELLVFGTIFGVLLLCCAPDMIWVNTDSDGIHYTYAAKYLYPAHKTSAPLFLLLGHLFLKLPFGTEFWRFGMLSVLASTVSAVFVYLIIKEKLGEKGRLYSLIGALVFGGSALVISQSTIVETYALVTMFGIGAYYFAIKKQWLWSAVMFGAGIAVHHIILIPLAVVFIANKEFRKWKYIGTIASFLLLYLYVPIAGARASLNMWGNVTPSTFLMDNVSTAWMLWGGLSIWELPKRILDAAGVVGVSLGLAMVPIGYYLWIRHDNANPIRKKHFKEPLLWLFGLPIAYYATNLAPQTYVYMVPAIGFGAVIAGITLPRMRHYWKYAVLGSAIGLLVFNANYFDIGRTLDPELSAKKYYSEELPKVPDGDILITQQGWEWAAVPSYNKENGKEIVMVNVGTLPSPVYQEWLQEKGVKFTVPKAEDIGNADYTTEFALSIMNLNENVWITAPTDPRTYGAEIVLAKGNEELLGWTSRGIINNEWQWEPSNPYDIITGAIEVEEWRDIVVSNYSVLTFGMLGIIGGVPAWIGYMVFMKKKKWSLKHEIRN